ncbi:MAG: hypothetical protein BWK79_19755 [Beggiatoa sp. IS2]|nr:MAG: hypothetical protein BWK79_19755 [Beggiatoa sp. IS2]
MYTQIILDDQLFKQAVELTGLNNPQDLIEAVLREFLNQHEKQEELAFTIACQQAKEQGEFLTEVEANVFINSLPR